MTKLISHDQFSAMEIFNDVVSVAGGVGDGDGDVVLKSIETFDGVWTVDAKELSVERRNFFSVFVSKYVIQIPS
jgi:hypothetical protein